MKKSVIAVLCILLNLVFCVNCFAEPLNSVCTETAEYIIENVPYPTVASVGGEWTVIGLARGDADVPDGYYATYVTALKKLLNDNNGIIDERKITEYCRSILALTAIGENPTDIDGHNLILPLYDYESAIRQGLNGAIWPLIAVNCGKYSLTDSATTEGKYLKYILNSQNIDGGFALNAGGSSDVDITAMAIQALSFYIADQRVSKAIEKALNWLSTVQTADGGFNSYGVSSSESCSQVLTALCSAGIDIDDSRFVKNGKTVFNALLSFRLPDGGFAHISGDKKSNLMATEQALYSIVALDRHKSKKSPLYDMTDVSKKHLDNNFPNKQSEIKIPDIIYQKKTFSDIDNHPNKSAIEELAKRGIISGKSQNIYDPSSSMTRAEFAAIIVRGLSLPTDKENFFDDVSAEQWFSGYIAGAFRHGIINGVSEREFNPLGTITKEEASVMLSRAAKLLGMSTQIYEPRDILSQFTDYTSASQWAWNELAFCCQNGIISNDEMELEPKKEITRAEIAQMIFNLIQEAVR